MSENETFFLDFIESFQDEYLSEFCITCATEICNSAFKEAQSLSSSMSNEKQIQVFLNCLIKYSQETKVVCKHFENGCPEKMNYEVYKKHSTECTFRPVVCKFCNGLFLSNELNSHMCGTYKRKKNNK